MCLLCAAFFSLHFSVVQKTKNSVACLLSICELSSIKQRPLRDAQDGWNYVNKSHSKICFCTYRFSTVAVAESQVSISVAKLTFSGSSYLNKLLISPKKIALESPFCWRELSQYEKCRCLFPDRGIELPRRKARKECEPKNLHFLFLDRPLSLRLSSQNKGRIWMFSAKQADLWIVFFASICTKLFFITTVPAEWADLLCCRTSLLPESS